jgi:hypothetical protein
MHGRLNAPASHLINEPVAQTELTLARSPMEGGRHSRLYNPSTSLSLRRRDHCVRQFWPDFAFWGRDGTVGAARAGIRSVPASGEADKRCLICFSVEHPPAERSG